MLNPKVVLNVLHLQLEPLRPWLEDKNVNEIMVNPGGHVFVEALGEIHYHGQLLTEPAIEMALTAVAKIVSQDAIANTATGIVNASIDDMRIAGAKRPASPDGSFFTIRKHQDKAERPSLEDLIEHKRALTRAQADLLIDLIIHNRKNCIIAGGTGSGKTTLTNALLSKIPPHERVVTIEDSRELHVPIPNIVPLIANPQEEGMRARDYVKLAMRLRPDRLVLGETRGDETYDLIRAFNSGHPGSISTVHADSAQQALSALEMLFQMSLPPGAQLSADLVRQYIAKSVNVVVFADRRIEVVDGKPLVVRKVTEILSLHGAKDGQYVFENLA